MRSTLLIPTLNEIDGVRLIMPRLDRSWVDEILVVDGGSQDGTVEYLTTHGYRVIRQRSRGICGAYWEGLAAASGEIIVAFSPDNNSVPELIPALIEKIRAGYDMAIASRYLPGAHSDDDDLLTAFGNRMFTGLVNVFFRARYTDTLVMFRAFRKDLVAELGLDEHRLPVFEYQLCIRCATCAKRVAEIPGDEPKRCGGVRKMRPFYNGLALFRQLLREVARR